MSRGKNDMRAVLEQNQAQQPKLEIVESVPESHSQRCPSRRGKKMAACYLGMDAYRQLKILCAETDMSIEDALKQGLNSLFIANNKPPIALN
ncbi:hypothetical protein C6503_03690 [Candidatus Poribacteria bacterium]|nr:MAG: hypothetical protein C6503_03690 [Candidatus Poribacteria bacterium]